MVHLTGRSGPERDWLQFEIVMVVYVSYNRTAMLKKNDDIIITHKLHTLELTRQDREDLLSSVCF